MEITVTDTWTSEQLAWHYNEIFYSGAKQMLQKFAEKHELDEVIKLFDSIIDFATLGETETTIELTKLNDIIWFHWDEILEFGGIN